MIRMRTPSRPSSGARDRLTRRRQHSRRKRAASGWLHSAAERISGSRCRAARRAGGSRATTTHAAAFQGAPGSTPRAARPGALPTCGDPHGNERGSNHCDPRAGRRLVPSQHPAARRLADRSARLVVDAVSGCQLQFERPPGRTRSARAVVASPAPRPGLRVPRRRDTVSGRAGGRRSSNEGRSARFGYDYLYGPFHLRVGRHAVPRHMEPLCPDRLTNGVNNGREVPFLRL